LLGEIRPAARPKVSWSAKSASIARLTPLVQIVPPGALHRRGNRPPPSSSRGTIERASTSQVRRARVLCAGHRARGPVNHSRRTLCDSCDGARRASVPTPRSRSCFAGRVEDRPQRARRWCVDRTRGKNSAYALRGGARARIDGTMGTVRAPLPPCRNGEAPPFVSLPPDASRFG